MLHSGKKIARQKKINILTPKKKFWTKQKTITINGRSQTVSGVEKLLSKLNPTKAAGPENIPPRVLKKLALFIAPIIFKISYESYESGTIPAIWKTANICQVFKKGKQFEVINYRPISLTCISCKLMETHHYQPYNETRWHT